MLRHLMIGAIILAGLAGGISVLSGGIPSTKSEPDDRLSHLANGSRKELLTAVEYTIGKCLDVLHLTRNSPQDLIPIATKIISNVFFDVVYLTFNKQMNRDKVSVDVAKTIEMNLDSVRRDLPGNKIKSLEKYINSISEHPDMAKCVISKLRTY